MTELLKMQYNTNIEILIQPISSLYDILPNKQTNTYLKELFLMNNYSSYISKTTEEKRDIYKLKYDVSNKILTDIYSLKFTNIIKNNQEFEFNYIVLPYDKELLKISYPDIDETKIINYDYDIESIINLIETNIRKTQYEHTNLQYIKIIYHVPLYDNNKLEYRYKKESIIKPIYYKDIFNQKNFEKIKKLPMITIIQIKDTIQKPIENIFFKLKKDKNNNIEYIKFLETFYNYSRNKKVRDDIIYKSKFYKVIILYSTDFLDKDITKLNNEYYYELPSISIEKEYIESIESVNIKDYLTKEKIYIDSRYKNKKDNYRCIGKIYKVGYNIYKFTLLLKELIFGNIYKLNDTINLYIIINSNAFGLIYNYVLYNEDEDDDEEEKEIKKIKYLQIENKKGILKIFDENDIKILKYNNIDKSSSDNNEFNISKLYKFQEDALSKYIKRKVSSIDMLNYLKSPSELNKYELFVEQYYPKLKKKKRKLENKVVTYKEDFKSFLTLLFNENSLFHLKPRDNKVLSNTQYKMKMDTNLSIYEFNNATNEIYKDALNYLLHKELQTKYNNIILNTKPDYIIYINLLLQKNIIKKTKYNCKEIQYKILKYTKRIISGGTLKLKESKKYSKQKRYNKYNRSCHSNRLLQRFSRRKA